MAKGWRRTLKLVGTTRDVKKDIDDYVASITKDSARIWLTEALSHIPTWSGASRATFEALAQSVGFVVTYGPITAFYNRQPLGTANGFGGLERVSQGYHTFYYSSQLRYLNFNDKNVAYVGVGGVKWGLINATPYQFVAKANVKFQEFASKASLPAPKFVSRTLK
jgi:hypothetical protein